MRVVKLEKDHKHGDVQYYAGQEVELPDDVAEFITGIKQADKLASRTVIKDEIKDEKAAK